MVSFRVCHLVRTVYLTHLRITWKEKISKKLSRSSCLVGLFVGDCLEYQWTMGRPGHSEWDYSLGGAY